LALEGDGLPMSTTLYNFAIDTVSEQSPPPPARAWRNEEARPAPIVSVDTGERGRPVGGQAPGRPLLDLDFFF